MGKGTAEPRVRINTKSAGRGKRRDVACLNEMFTLLTCYKTNNFEEGKCAAEAAWIACLELAPRLEEDEHDQSSSESIDSVDEEVDDADVM